MAYQNVGTPRFYINDISYARNMGIDITDLEGSSDYSDNFWGGLPYHPERFNLDDYYKLVDDDPTNSISFTPEEQAEFIVRYRTFQRDPSLECNYVAFLNHNLDSSKFCIGHTAGDINLSSHSNNANHLSSIVNGEGSFNDTPYGMVGIFCRPWHDGFSICEITNSSISGDNRVHNFHIYGQHTYWDTEPWVGREYRIGAIFLGRYFDMPVSPDLDLSMTVEFDGYDNTTTLGGSTLTNVRYTGSPWWSDANGNKIEPWSVADYGYVGTGGTSSGFSKRNGRRVWSMNFSYMSDKDIFASNYMSTTYTETDTDYDSGDMTTDIDDNTIFNYTLENDNSFIAQVLNKVGNGQRFIFQPDNTNNNPDQFAICVLDQDSLKIDQVAYKVYSISLKIMEVW